MKQAILFFILTTLISCGQSPVESTATIQVSQDSTKNISTNKSKELILGERINGPANIRDSVNGKAIFSLYDKTLVTCTEQQDGWYAVGLSMEIPNKEYNIDTLRKGRKIILEGKVVGEILKDISVSTATTYKKTWAELIGYTYKDNIYSYSIIEESLKEHLSKSSDRTIQVLQPFIDNFGMEKSAYDHFIAYSNYENWIDDPSPLMRIELVFEADKLIGIVHSRQIDLPHTSDYKLERGFEVAFYNDTNRQAISDFIKTFNQFINFVD